MVESEIRFVIKSPIWSNAWNDRSTVEISPDAVFSLPPKTRSSRESVEVGIWAWKVDKNDESFEEKLRSVFKPSFSLVALSYGGFLARDEWILLVVEINSTWLPRNSKNSMVQPPVSKWRVIGLAFDLKTRKARRRRAKEKSLPLRMGFKSPSLPIREEWFDG